MNIFFTADWHLNHANLIKYCLREQYMSDYEKQIIQYGTTNEIKKLIISKHSLKKMNDNIISKCNERVKIDDLLFFNGDIGFKSGTKRGEGEPEKLKKFIERINCKKIIFIEGNHDKKGKNSIRTPIQKVIIRHGGKNIAILHNPEFADVNYEINLTAHCHNKWKFKRIRKDCGFTDCINVGVDVWDFYPVTWNEIMKEYHKWLKEEKLIGEKK